MLKAAIHGTGRMAAAIATVTECTSDLSIIALAGPLAPAWETAIPWYRSLADLTTRPDLLIDFTLPEGTRTAAAWSAANQVPLLSGVTGLSDEILTDLKATASLVPVLWSPNLSLGVNLLADLAARASAVLNERAPVMIKDVHHQWKKDAPSGTALMLGAGIAGQRDGDHERIEYESVREGEVIGEHTVTFKLAGEEFDLVHRAHGRSIYAQGALNAGAWLAGQPPGLYSAADWLRARG